MPGTPLSFEGTGINSRAVITKTKAQHGTTVGQLGFDAARMRVAKGVSHRLSRNAQDLSAQYSIHDLWLTHNNHAELH